MVHFTYYVETRKISINIFAESLFSLLLFEPRNINQVDCIIIKYCNDIFKLCWQLIEISLNIHMVRVILFFDSLIIF